MTATDNPEAMSVRIAPERLIAFAADVYQQVGVSRDDALLVADSLVQADLWGHQSHGLLRLGWYLARVQSGAMKPQTLSRLEVDGGAIAVLDGADGLGQVVARQATEEAISRAKKHGVGVVSVRNSNHFGTCMYFTRMGAAQNCITLLMSNGGPNMAPWGGLKKKIGTNPWSIAAPAGRYGAMVMDMANSGVARGKIYLANNRRERIPEGWAIDAQGHPTTDPKAALEGFILPMAGHKGYVMGVMVDVLSGVLSRSGFLEGVHGPYDPLNRSRAGHLVLALNIEAFQPVAEFHASMERYIESLKDVPLAAGHSQVFYPGEMEQQADLANRTQGGVQLAVDTLSDLRRIERQLGLSYPDIFAQMG